MINNVKVGSKEVVHLRLILPRLDSCRLDRHPRDKRIQRKLKLKVCWDGTGKVKQTLEFSINFKTFGRCKS